MTDATDDALQALIHGLAVDPDGWEFPLSPAQVGDIEQQLGYALPQDYRTCVMQYGLPGSSEIQR